MWRLRTGKDEVHGGNGQFFVGLRQKQEVLVPGVVLHLLQSDSGFVETAVEVPVAVLEEAVLRTASVRVLGSVSSF